MRKPVHVVSVIAVGCVAIAIWTRYEREDRSPVRAHEAPTHELGGESNPQQDVANESPEPAIGAPARQPIKAAPTVVQPADPVESDSKLDRLLKREQALLKDPAYREARKKKRFVELASNRPDLAKALRISQDEADALLLLVAEQELRFAEEAAPNPRTEREAQARELELQRQSEATDAEISALVGESAARLWKQYEASVRARQVVHELQAGLSAGPHPLREDQVEALVWAIHDEHVASGNERRTLMTSIPWTPEMVADSRRITRDHMMQSAEAANKRIRAAASSILSNGQFDYLDDLLERQLERTRAYVRLEEAEAKAQAR